MYFAHTGVDLFSNRSHKRRFVFLNHGTASTMEPKGCSRESKINDVGVKFQGAEGAVSAATLLATLTVQLYLHCVSTESAAAGSAELSEESRRIEYETFKGGDEDPTRERYRAALPYCHRQAEAGAETFVRTDPGRIEEDDQAAVRVVQTPRPAHRCRCYKPEHACT